MINNMNGEKNKLLERFLRYVKIDTQSNESVADKIHPSTEGQMVLLNILKEELLSFGLNYVELDKNGYLLARIPATDSSKTTIGFSAHVDTAEDVKGNGVKPFVINNYDGKDVVLNNGDIVKVSDNPELEKYIGTTLIFSDGTTLLGSDDKAGVSIIMSFVEYLVSHQEIKHGEIEILFSPDEETGYGMDFFDIKKLHSKALYTVDGSSIYTIEDECFNAASFTAEFVGVATHLGYARGRMVNALTMCAHFITLLPQAESPEGTDGRYGYYCAHKISGNIAEARLDILIRDFDYDNLMRRINFLISTSETIRNLYGGEIKTDYKISYKNMHMASEKQPLAMLALMEAGKSLGQDLRTEIIRGGTDGARIAEHGISCPNIYTGGHNLHSCHEWASLDAMFKSYELITELVKKWAELN